MTSADSARIASPFAGDAMGQLLVIRGSNAVVGLRGAFARPEDEHATVGSFLGIAARNSLVIGVVGEVTVESSQVARELGFDRAATIDFLGEIRSRPDGTRYFQRGVTEYPKVGDVAAVIAARDLRLVYDLSGVDTIEIGELHQDAGVPACVNVDEMLSKHFAILGTTGVGKSSGVAVVIREILEKRSDLRIFLIDPHNEYGRCFGDRAEVLTPANLRLPFWLFNFEEIVDVIFRGRPGVDDEIEILAEVIPLARKMYAQTREAADGGSARRLDLGYTVDTPVPYRLTDLTGMIDERMGRLETRVSRIAYSKLLARIGSVCNDPRYAFMFENANVGGDTMAEVLSQLFRLPTGDRPMTIMQLAGFPAEVVDSVVSVLGRMAFDFGLWSDGSLPLLFVCEEAHRYASANHKIGFGPTRRAISRIAKEGRKYGVFLGLVSQRPAELDPTIVSQCSTLFVMRMSNERDQEIVRAAVSDAAANTLGFVPSLGTREAFAFGEGVALPTRLRFRDLPAEYLPKSDAVSNASADFGRRVGEDFIATVIDRWRGATLSKRIRPADEGAETNPVHAQRRPLDPERYSILKKQVRAVD
jgi:hypothetical protein